MEAAATSATSSSLRVEAQPFQPNFAKGLTDDNNPQSKASGSNNNRLMTAIQKDTSGKANGNRSSTKHHGKAACPLDPAQLFRFQYERPLRNDYLTSSSNSSNNNLRASTGQRGRHQRSSRDHVMTKAEFVQAKSVCLLMVHICVSLSVSLTVYVVG
jgi:hypothetical protein